MHVRLILVLAERVTEAIIKFSEFSSIVGGHQHHHHGEVKAASIGIVPPDHALEAVQKGQEDRGLQDKSKELYGFAIGGLAHIQKREPVVFAEHLLQEVENIFDEHGDETAHEQVSEALPEEEIELPHQADSLATHCCSNTLPQDFRISVSVYLSETA